MKVIYLAGGLRHDLGQDWRDVIREIAPFHAYIDPSVHGFTDPKDYVGWDLNAVGKADLIIFAMEEENPSGIGAAVEVGYAHAMGTDVWFVDLMGLDDKRRHHFDMIRQISDHNFRSLQDVGHALKSWGRFQR